MATNASPVAVTNVSPTTVVTNASPVAVTDVVGLCLWRHIHSSIRQLFAGR